MGASITFGASKNGLASGLTGAKSQSLKVSKTDLIQPGKVSTQPPNIVLINADDLGFGDLGCYGSQAIKTPNLDKLATEGMRFTDFYSCNALCTPSRTGLLTGRYPQRVGMNWVIWAEDAPLADKLLRKVGQWLNKVGSTDIGADSEVRGLPEDEITIAEGLKKAGYQTGCIGKWHQGDFRFIPKYNPCNNGFDYFYGMPWDHEESPCPLYENYEKVKEGWDDLADIHQDLADGAIGFLKRASQSSDPFFLYFAPPDPHIPLHPSKKYKGKSGGGIYGDVVEELDTNVGQILDFLNSSGLEENTLVLFTSDNGPWYHGSTGGQRGRKGQSYEGGFNVPMIARWPKHIPAGSVCNEAAMNIDFFPTLLRLAGLQPPKDRIIDGKDISGLLSGTLKETPHDALYFYHHAELEGVRVGKWKFYQDISPYVYPIPVDKNFFSKFDSPWLYNMETDPTESYPLNETHPDIVKQLTQLMDKWDAAMKKNPRGWLK